MHIKIYIQNEEFAYKMTQKNFIKLILRFWSIIKIFLGFRKNCGLVF